MNVLKKTKKKKKVQKTEPDPEHIQEENQEYVQEDPETITAENPELIEVENNDDDDIQIESTAVAIVGEEENVEEDDNEKEDEEKTEKAPEKQKKKGFKFGSKLKSLNPLKKIPKGKKDDKAVSEPEKVNIIEYKTQYLFCA